MRRRQILIAGPGNSGKTTLALDYGMHVRKADGGDTLSIDYEGLQGLFHTDDEGAEDPANGVYCFTRVVTPTYYEVQVLAAKLANPTTPTPKLLVGERPVNPDLVRDPVRAVLKDIQGGRRYGTFLLDTMTRYADDLVTAVFAEKIAAAGGNVEAVDKMRQPIYGAIRHAMEDFFVGLIGADVNVVATAWSKGKWNQARRTVTDEQVLDISGVLKTVETYSELILMLVKRQNEQGHTVYPSDAILLKSKTRSLPEGAMIEAVDWDQVFGAEPRLTVRPSYAEPVPPGVNGPAHEELAEADAP